jgi:threonine/homoserine/homoserine lactone efflux protein
MTRESYLQALATQLRRRGIQHSRVLEEAQGHLSDAIDQGLQEGLSFEAAEQRALERFGSVQTVAGQFETARPRLGAWAAGGVALTLGIVWAVLSRDWSKLDVLGTQNVLVFAGTGILLNLTPGQDTMYILARSVTQGRRAGVLSVLGIVSGTFLHTVAAALGLSAVFAASARAFTVVKLAGAAYLVYLGMRLLFHRSPPARHELTDTTQDSWTIYRSGLLTNLLNLKVALFFLAFLPQFVAPAANSRTLAFLFLGAVFMTTGAIWSLLLAWFGSLISGRLRARPSTRLVLERAIGAVFVGVGVKLAVGR